MSSLHKWEKCKQNSKRCFKTWLIRNSKILKNKSKRREFSLDSIIYQTVIMSSLQVMMSHNNTKRRLMVSKRRVASLTLPIAFHLYQDWDKTVKLWSKDVKWISKRKRPMIKTQELFMELSGQLWLHLVWTSHISKTSVCINKKFKWQLHKTSRLKRDSLTNKESFKFWPVQKPN